MADHAGFLQAICDDPDEDAHRLVYADWLEEQGESARAQFIRAQLQLARFYRKESDPFETGVWADELLPEHRQAFLAPLLALGLKECATRRHFYASDPGCVFFFRRGFVEDVEVRGGPALAQLTGQADRLFALTPLQNIRISPLRGEDVGFESISVFTLSFFLRLPQVSRLRTLDLRDHRLGNAGALALLNSPHLSRKTRLFFEGNQLPPEARQALEGRFGDAISCGPDYDDDIPF